MKVRKNILRMLLLMALSAGMMYCANPVSPTGGPVDETAPMVVESEPPNYSTHFNRNRIIITFNEFVQLQQPNQQVLISPPLRENPSYKIRGRSVVVDFNEELQPNTTYSIFFGNAITDLTAGNPLGDYLFAFSTGDHIDSLAIGGEVLNAFNLQPQENVLVMLYPPDNDTVPRDSLPMLVRPLYVAKTNAAGVFQLRNLRNEPYKIFALNDMNSNYLYDLPNEEIAFIDSLIAPEVFEIPAHDTAVIH
ncbi:MAG: Ig-like domain-containing protein, partial [Bacteroidales bacterium]